MRVLPLVLFGCLAVVGAGALVLAPTTSVIGEYSTSLVGRTKNQRINCLRAAAALDGKVIPAQGVLSFNQTVGTWTKDRGFVRAPVSYNGHLTLAYGGAVCQASTTFYNAALLAGMEVVERHRHRFAPTYVAPGRDAAVSFPDLDLLIKNPYSQPVTVKSLRRGDHLVFQLLSKGIAKPGVIVQPVIHTVAPIREVHVGSGNEVKPHRGKAGFDVTIYRLWPNGDRELISTDDYPAMDRVQK